MISLVVLVQHTYYMLDSEDGTEFYEGEWNADKKEGRGKYTDANGNVYEGEWKADKRKGRGKYTYATGNDAACCFIG